MKVLLTGSQGYIGTILAQVLLDAGYDVVGLDTGFYSEGVLYEMPQKEYPLIKKDIRHVTVQDVAGFDAVIHLAELSNDPLGQTNPAVTYGINHEGTRALINASKQAGVKRFIYSSSCSIYGASNDMRDEHSAPQPLTEYAKCKVLNEQALLEAADDTFTSVILRNATVFGASPRMRFDLVVNNLAGLAWTTKEIKMESDGTPWRPFVHVRDVAQAFLCVLQAPREVVHKEIFNVGDTQANYQIRDIASVISQEFPDCLVALNPNGADKRNYRVNFDKINSKLPGFSCQHDIARGAKELRSAFEQIAMDEQTFQSRLYTRLKQIKHLQETGQLNKQLFWQTTI